MKHISILEQPTKEAIQAFAKKRDLQEHLPETYQHPQEDCLVDSETPPVFVVADGVTLNFMKLIETDTKYPNPSPAGDVARIFCDAVIEQAKENYSSVDENEAINIFKEANKKVGEYNNKVGKNKVSGNITDFYAAAGSFVIIKDTKAYWVSICDAFVVHFNKDMNKKFMSSGSCSPYAVINGEERMVEHVEHGVFDLKPGDRLFVFTDGFEHYMKNQDFLNLFKNWADDLNDRIAQFSHEANLDDPEKYGHERSIIGVTV